MPTHIQWTDETWNPVTGCSKVSQGCKHCYAETIAKRFWGDRKFTDVQCHPERLDQPLRWRKPRMVFVNSMSDLFHEDVPDDFIAQVFAVMAQARHHTFQVLTKRPERMRSMLKPTLTAQRIPPGFVADPGAGIHGVPALPNVWLGVSAEDQATFDARTRYLQDTPAAVRFVSLEPMIGPIDVTDALRRCWNPECIDGWLKPDGRQVCAECLPSRLDWVIVGGESGPGARPFDIQWARDIIHQCRAAGVPCFIKQLGALPHQSNPPSVHGQFRSRAALGITHPKGGAPDEWPPDLRVREMPEVQG